MAISIRKFAAVALLAACAAAAAQEREQLPIQVEASGGTDYDYANGVLKFYGITITQGAVRISADNAVANSLDFKKDSNWEFTGTVRISMPDSKLACDTARVHFSDGEILSAAVTGAPATFEQKREDQLAQGRANHIDYDLKRGTAEFAGNAWLSDGKTELTGETLTYSTANQQVVSHQPVVITIQPGEAPQTKPKPKPQP
jgi:lipopolysaccharide transport protein LptA